MTPLSDALTAAQRSALAALEKAYVAGGIDADEAIARFDACGVRDPVDVAFLLSALTVLREWGISVPPVRCGIQLHGEQRRRGLRRARLRDQVRAVSKPKPWKLYADWPAGGRKTLSFSTEAERDKAMPRYERLGYRVSLPAVRVEER
jgi:hypothetical protein